MKVELAYGKGRLAVNLPDDHEVRVVEPRYLPGLADPAGALRAALCQPIGSPPLAEWVGKEARVGIIFSDITRPAPHQLLLPAILEQLQHVPRQNITLFNALGTHRRNTEAELRGMLGDDLVDHYTIIQNDAFDPSTQVCLGTTSWGHEFWVNREAAGCDVRILSGFIEPHFFAGFSGGGKAVMPGMAGLRSVLGNHDAAMIGNPQASWGITRGNPVFEEIREAERLVGQNFLLNVTLNRDKHITGVFAGDVAAAHDAGCDFSRQTAMVALAHAYDIVITSNSGYPLDLNLYQSVKGMSAAARAVKQGGAIILAAQCWDGIPEHGMYGRLLAQSPNPEALLARICAPGFLEQDQWQAQIQALIQRKADVYVAAEGLTEQQVRGAHLIPVVSVEETVAELLKRCGPGASICVLPEGPQTIPNL